MLWVLLGILYLLVGFVVAHCLRDEVGRHDVEGGALVLVLWPIFLFIVLVLKLLKAAGYRV